MSVRKGMRTALRSGRRLAEAEAAVGNEAPAPRKPTWAENLIVTIQLLAGFAVLGAVLWGIDRWTAAR